MCEATFFGNASKMQGRSGFQCLVTLVMELIKLAMGNVRDLGTPGDVRQSRSFGRRWHRVLGPPLLGDRDIHGLRVGSPVRKSGGGEDAEPGRELAVEGV